MSAVLLAVPHIKARFSGPGYVLEHCEDTDCSVHGDGSTDCGRSACPACGYGGANLFAAGPELVGCSCGHTWPALG